MDRGAWQATVYGVTKESDGHDLVTKTRVSWLVSECGLELKSFIQ